MTENNDLEKIQSNIKRFVTILEQCPIIDGYLVKNYNITNGVGNYNINHKLGRIPRGILMVNHTYYNVYRIVSLDNKTVRIYWPYSNPCIADFWIF